MITSSSGSVGDGSASQEAPSRSDGLDEEDFVRDIAVLYFEDCPNVSVVLGHLVDCDVDPRTVRMVVVGSGPIPSGFAGSPTVLIDGVNPVGISGDGFDVSCSLRMPTAEQLRDALGD